MSVGDLLRQRRAAILTRWGDAILSTYPADGARFFATERDPFHNPVGSTVRNAVGPIFDWLLGGAGEDALASSLDAIVRVRAVQSFTPAQAVGFVFVLKRVIAEESADAEGEDGELARLFERIDELALRAFDVFVSCRERVAEIRVREERARTYALLRRAGAVDVEREPDDGPGPGHSARGGAEE